MLSIQYYPFGCQNGQQNRQQASLRIAPSATPMLSAHAVHLLSEARSRHNIAQRAGTPGRAVEPPSRANAQRVDSGDPPAPWNSSIARPTDSIASKALEQRV